MLCNVQLYRSIELLYIAPAWSRHATYKHHLLSFTCPTSTYISIYRNITHFLLFGLGTAFSGYWSISETIKWNGLPRNTVNTNIVATEKPDRFLSSLSPCRVYQIQHMRLGLVQIYSSQSYHDNSKTWK